MVPALLALSPDDSNELSSLLTLNVQHIDASLNRYIQMIFVAKTEYNLS